MAINEVFQLCRDLAAFKIKAAQQLVRYSMRYISGAVGFGIEHHPAQRIAMLPGQQRPDLTLHRSAWGFLCQYPVADSLEAFPDAKRRLTLIKKMFFQ